MGIFDHNLEEAVKIQAHTIESLIKINDRLEKEKSHLEKALHHCLCHKKPHPVRLTLLLILSNPSKLEIMSVTLASNQKVVGSLSLIDSVTNTDVPATFAGTTATSDNEAVATASVQADGTVVITGVSAGTANVTVNSNASFTDSLGNAASGAVNTIVQATVTAVQTADGVQLVVTFGAPQAQ